MAVGEPNSERSLPASRGPNPGVSASATHPRYWSESIERDVRAKRTHPQRIVKLGKVRTPRPLFIRGDCGGRDSPGFLAQVPQAWVSGEAVIPGWYGAQAIFVLSQGCKGRMWGKLRVSVVEFLNT